MLRKLRLSQKKASLIKNKMYLDLKTIDNEIDTLYKDTHTGQYLDFSSYTPFPLPPTHYFQS